jgi:outer membrane murein-binding lipoprotein Lpp
MSSMPNPEQTDPHEVAVTALKQAYQLIGRGDKQLPRVDVSKSEQDATRHPSDQQKRFAIVPRRSSRGRLALQGLVGLLMAACIAAAALAFWSHDDAAKQVLARGVPQLYLISSPAPESAVLAQSSPSAVQASEAKGPPSQPALPASAAQTTLAGSAPTAPPPGQAQLLQSMAGERAAVEQEIEQLKTSIEQLKTAQEQMVRNVSAVAEQLKAAQEQMVRDNVAVAEQLKASQEQMVRDNAAVAGQLKASQEQMARLIAKTSEQQLRPKTSAPPPRPIAAPTGKPAPKLSSPQARAQPLAPVQRPE